MELPAIFLGKAADVNDAGMQKPAVVNTGEAGGDIFAALLHLPSAAGDTALAGGVAADPRPEISVDGTAAPTAHQRFDINGALHEFTAISLPTQEGPGALLSDISSAPETAGDLLAASLTPDPAADRVNSVAEPVRPDDHRPHPAEANAIAAAEAVAAVIDEGAARNTAPDDSTLETGGRPPGFDISAPPPPIPDAETIEPSLPRTAGPPPGGQGAHPLDDAGGEPLTGEKRSPPEAASAKPVATGIPAPLASATANALAVEAVDSEALVSPHAAGLPGANEQNLSPQGPSPTAPAKGAAALLPADGGSVPTQPAPAGTKPVADVKAPDAEAAPDDEAAKAKEAPVRPGTERGQAPRPNANLAELARPASPAQTPVAAVKTLIAPNGVALTHSLPDGQDGDAALSASGGGTIASSTQIRVSSVNGPATAVQLPINAIAAHISSQAANGNRRFDIRLNPPELGRIDVRLEISRDGSVTTHLVVEKPETLDFLQRDARALERALQDTGLKTADNGLNFSLKDQGLAGQSSNGRESYGKAGGGEPAVEEEGLAEHSTGEGGPAGEYTVSRGLDIRI